MKSNRRTPRLLMFLTAFWLLSPRPARGADSDEDARILALFREGNTLFHAGRDADAEAVYEKAWAVRKTHDVAGNLALAELNQGKALEALEHLQFALEHMPAGAAKKRRATIDGAHAKALAGVALLKIVVEPKGATVTVDGPLTVMVAEGLAVAPGARVVRASLPGFATLEQRITAAAGATQEVKLTLVEDRVAAAAPVQTSQTPTSAAASATQAPNASTNDGPSRVPVWIAAGVGVALLGGAVGCTVAAGGAEDDADAERAALQKDKVDCTRDASRCAALSDAAESHDRLKTASGWLFVGAGVAAGAAVALWFWPLGAENDEPSAAVVVPVVSADGVGAIWTGRF